MSTVVPNELSIKAEFLPSLEHVKRITSHKPKEGVIHPSSKTLILAINFQGGVLILSDKRVVDWGYQLQSDNTRKIKAITKFSVLGASGASAMCDFYIECLQKATTRFERRYKAWLSPDGQANYLKNLIELVTEEMDFLSYAEPLLVAYDNLSERGRIFYFQPESPLAAYLNEEDKFGGTGCGYMQLKAFLIHEVKKKTPLNLGDALSISMMAYALAGMTSIGVTDIRIELPHIAIITKNGVQFVKEKMMMTYFQKIDKILFSGELMREVEAEDDL
ncbi:MAG: hypothetical protein HYW77_02850 [Parcubacteria group bacterium]|nr:hypothetical protein [Parcubacteria group bacterium]